MFIFGRLQRVITIDISCEVLKLDMAGVQLLIYNDFADRNLSGGVQTKSKLKAKKESIVEVSKTREDWEFQGKAYPKKRFANVSLFRVSSE